MFKKNRMLMPILQGCIKTQFTQRKEPILEEKAYKQKIRGCVSGLKGVPGFIT